MITTRIIMCQIVLLSFAIYMGCKTNENIDNYNKDNPKRFVPTMNSNYLPKYWFIKETACSHNVF